MADPAQTLIVRVFQWLLGCNVIEPKSEMGPKFVLDPKELGIKIGPRKRFSDWIRIGPRGKIVKSYKQAQKEFWAQGI